MTISLPTAVATREFGRRLGERLRAGDLVVLSGPLGAGKTALTQGIGLGLGVSSAVVSPTFVIARVHEDGRIPLVHVDAYRLGSLAELDELDLDVSFDAAVTVVEWGAGVAEQLSETYLHITMRRDDDTEQRWATLECEGGDWAERLSGLTSGMVDA